MNRTKLFVLPGLAAAVIGALLFLCARDAVAAEIVGPGSTWAKEIKLHAPGPAGPPITVLLEPCPGLVAGGCWSPWNSTIYVSSRLDEAFIFAHELGHAFATRNLSDDERKWFLSIFGFDQSTPWDPDRTGDPYCLRVACPTERFADAYALCALGLRPSMYYRNGAVMFDSKSDDVWYYGKNKKAVALTRERVCRTVSDAKDPA